MHKHLHVTKVNKAIVDYTSPVLCTPVTPFPPIGDAAYRQHGAGGPSQQHRQHAQQLVKIKRVAPEISSRTDRHTDKHVITITSQPSLPRRSKYHLVTAVPHFPVKTIDCRDLCARRDPRREHSILQYVTLTLMFTKSVTVSAAVSTGISCHQGARATRCIMANVLQTKVDAQCDKLATDLS